MDNYCEQLVVKSKTPGQNLLHFALIFLTFFIGLMAFFFASSINLVVGFIIGGIIITLGLWLLTLSYYENEYIFTNGELDVDKIIARRKRKRLITVEIKGISDLNKLSALNGNIKKQGAVILDASDGTIENTIYIDFKSNKYGNTRLLFSPNESVKTNIKKYLPRNLKNNIE